VEGIDVHPDSRSAPPIAFCSAFQRYFVEEPPGTPLVMAEPEDMALPFDDSKTTSDKGDPRALAILAKTIYRELRSSGYGEKDVICLAGELLGMVASDVKDARKAPPGE
jgi:hypothetical protein